MRAPPTTAAPRSRRVLFVYVGDEQVAWGRQAFPTPRHYYVMPGILYLEAVLRERAANLGLDAVNCLYLNRAAETLEEMLLRIREAAPALLGFSCYSWNLQASLELARLVKERDGNVRIACGGPEVSFRQASEAASFLAEQTAVDAIVAGEAEDAVVPLTAALLDGRTEPVPNATLRRDGRIAPSARAAEPCDPARLPRVHPSAVRVRLTPGAGRAAVIETVRGCPYTCIYCSFNGGAGGVRRFPMERVTADLEEIFAARFELLNFADPVLDLSRDRAKTVLGVCLDHNVSTSLTCYAAFQGMDEELADFFAETKMLVGVGLQSVFPDVLEAVARRFSVDRFFDSLAAVGDRPVNYYVDLMFGLPGDTLGKFERTFDEVLALRPPFVMPFPLTIIPRSRLHADLEAFGVVRYSDEAVARAVRPSSGLLYADIGLGKGFSLADLARFDDVAVAIFYTFQRYPTALYVLCAYARSTAERGHDLSAFRIFESVGGAIRAHLGGEPIDVANPPRFEGPVRAALSLLLEKMGASAFEQEAFQSLLRLEATAASLLERPDRKAVYEVDRARQGRRVPLPLPDDDADLFVALCATHRVVKLPAAHADLEALGSLRERLAPRTTSVIVLAPYDDWRARVVEISPLEESIVGNVPQGRETRLASLARRAAGRGDGATWRQAVARLVDLKVLGVYEGKTVRSR